MNAPTLPKGRPACTAKPPCTFEVVPLENITVEFDGPAVGRKAVAFPQVRRIYLEQSYWDSVKSVQGREAILAHERGHIEGARCEPCADFRAGEILRREGAPNVRDGARGLLGGLDNRDSAAAAGALVAGFGLDDGHLFHRERGAGVDAQLEVFMDRLAAEGVQLDGEVYDVEVQVNGGVRTNAVQFELFKKGRAHDPSLGDASNPKAWVVVDASKVVTNASSSASGPHPNGKAVDFAVRVGGVAVLYPSQVGMTKFERLYTALGEMAEDDGFKWGGRFTVGGDGQRDWGHVEVDGWRLLTPKVAKVGAAILLIAAVGALVLK